MFIDGINRSHLTSNDRWTAESVNQLRSAMESLGEVATPTAVVIGNGMMPYLLPVVKPDQLIIVDQDPAVTSINQRWHECVSIADSWEEALWLYTDEIVSSGPHPRYQRGKNATIDFDALRQFTTAEQAGIADLEAVKSRVLGIEIKTVLGDITEPDTATKVAAAVGEGTVTFLNMTNVASWLRPRGVLSPMSAGRQRTKQFIEAIGASDTAVIVDSDKRLKPAIHRKASYTRTM